MRYTQADLDRAQCHAEDGERRVDEQRQRIVEQRTKGMPTGESERVLSVMLDLLAQIRAHRNEIERHFKAAEADVD